MKETKAAHLYKWKQAKNQGTQSSQQTETQLKQNQN